MTMNPITEDDLHGFVDQRLEPKRLAEVRAYLAEHPEISARIAGYAEQRETLRAALAPIAEEPLPTHLNLARMIETRRHPRPVSPWWLSAAAGVALALLYVAVRDEMASGPVLAVALSDASDRPVAICATGSNTLAA